MMVLGGSRVGPRGASEPDAIVSGHWGRAAAGRPARSVNEKAPPPLGLIAPRVKYSHARLKYYASNTPQIYTRMHASRRPRPDRDRVALYAVFDSSVCTLGSLVLGVAGG